uniref:Mitochondrial carrier protein n=1 Tax=Rhizochromulina marina TaxID=1034831 RepID=A0A7S2W9D0_9STRA|mmetsp:Transcript_17881/g.52226  ORF Transcript_17881/g.52226 Transcript_17881/m.52226 type:complete len:294 (+) Transcript_17881:302-1183(+)
MDVVIDLAVGSFAGAVGVLVGHPLDVIKVRMQQSSQYRSMLDCTVKTLRGEGPLGFLKGVGPPLASVAAYQAVCFASFNMALSAITTESEENASMGTLFAAGCISGAATVPVTTPTDLVKIRLQLQTDAANRQYSGMIDCAAQIWRSEGWTGLLRGLEATAYRDVFATGFYFVAYHQVKRTCQRTGIFGERSEPAELFAGGCAGVASWGSASPFDVVKTRMQAENAQMQTSALQYLFRIIREEGYSRLVRGLGPLLSRAFFVNAVTFYAYEEGLRLVQSLQDCYTPSSSVSSS